MSKPYINERVAGTLLSDVVKNIMQGGLNVKNAPVVAFKKTASGVTFEIVKTPCKS